MTCCGERLGYSSDSDVFNSITSAFGSRFVPQLVFVLGVVVHSFITLSFSIQDSE